MFLKGYRRLGVSKGDSSQVGAKGERMRQTLLLLACIALCLAILVFDAYTPLGMVEWMLYLLPLSLVFWLVHWRHIVFVGSLCMLFMAIGFLISPLGGIAWHLALINRTIGVGVLSLTTIVLVQRKKTEEALRESPEKLRSVFASCPDAIVVSDLNGNAIECNQATLDALGYSSTRELIGKDSLALIARQDRERAMSDLRKTLEQGSTRNLEYVCVAKDGREFPAELSASVIRDSSGTPTGFVAIAKDISERKKMEQEIRTFTHFLGAAVNNSPDLIFIKDRDLRYVVVSDAACHFIGRPRKEILGRTAQDLYPRDYADSVERTDREVLEKDAVVDVPGLARVRGEESRVFHTRKAPLRDASGNITHIISIARDVSERMRMEEALKQSEAKLKALHRHVKALSVAKSIEEVAKHTLDAMEFTLGFNFAGFLTAENGYLHNRGRRGGELSILKMPLDGPGVTTKAANTQKTLRIPDTTKEPAFVDNRVVVNGERLEPMLSELAVPVLIDDKAVAVLNVENARLNAFTDEDQELLETLALHVSSAFGRLRQVDTLEKKVGEQTRELKASEEEYCRLVDNMTDAVFSIDLKGNFTFCSRAAEKLSGYPVQQLLSMNMKELIAPEHFLEIQERLSPCPRREIPAATPVRDHDSRWKAASDRDDHYTHS